MIPNQLEARGHGDTRPSRLPEPAECCWGSNRQEAPVLIPVVRRGWTVSTGLPLASPGMYLHGFTQSRAALCPTAAVRVVSWESEQKDMTVVFEQRILDMFCHSLPCPVRRLRDNSLVCPQALP